MFCRKCGNSINDGSRFCSECGSKLHEQEFIAENNKRAESSTAGQKDSQSSISPTDKDLIKYDSFVDQLHAKSKNIIDKGKNTITERVSEIKKDQRIIDITKQSKDAFEKTKKLVSTKITEIKHDERLIDLGHQSKEVYEKAKINAGRTIDALSDKKGVLFDKTKDAVSSKFNLKIVGLVIARMIIMPFFIFCFFGFIVGRSLITEGIADKENYKTLLNRMNIYEQAANSFVKIVSKDLGPELNPYLYVIINKDSLKNKVEPMINEFFDYITIESKKSFNLNVSIASEKQKIIIIINSLIDNISSSIGIAKWGKDILLSEINQKMDIEGFAGAEKEFINIILSKAYDNEMKAINDGKVKSIKNNLSQLKLQVADYINISIKDEYTLLRKSDFNYFNGNVLDKLKTLIAEINSRISELMIISLVLFILIILLSMLGPKINILFWTGVPLLGAGLLCLSSYSTLLLSAGTSGILAISFVKTIFYNLFKYSLILIIVSTLELIIFIFLKIKFRKSETVQRTVSLVY